MTFLLIAAAVVAMILLYATDRLLKALARARRYRVMSDRLDAVAVRSEEQQEQRTSAAKASTELTSVLPAIGRPPLTLPGLTRPPRRAAAGREARPGHDSGTGRRARRPHPRPGDRPTRPGRTIGPRQP